MKQATKATRIARLKQWADALRSGEYKQAHAELRAGRTNEMCCLGVLCDVVAPTRWDGHTHTGVRGKESNAGFAPASVLRLAGLSGDDALDLASLNDSGEASFEEIADVVDWIRYDTEAE